MVKQIESARSYKGKNVRIYFAGLTDEEIQDLVIACEAELEIRSQESMVTS